MLTQPGNGCTSILLAAGCNIVDTLNIMWVWTEETQLNTNELRYKYLLSIDNTGSMVWHRAADKCNLLSLDTVWSCAKGAELNTDEFLFTQPGNGCTGFLLAAECNILETLNIMWVWIEEKQLNPNELKKYLFVPKDNDVHLTWHLEITGDTLEALDKMWS